MTRAANKQTAGCCATVNGMKDLATLIKEGGMQHGSETRPYSREDAKMAFRGINLTRSI